MDINIVLSITVVSMALIGYTISRLGEGFFSAASRNPIVAEKSSTLVIILASMIELFGLIMVMISLYITFVK